MIRTVINMIGNMIIIDIKKHGYSQSLAITKRKQQVAMIINNY